MTFPDNRVGFEVSPVARDCIKRLLDKDKRSRLGAKEDVKEILEHPFFEGLDIDKLLKKELVPPYKPVINDDLKFFDSNITEMKNIQESVIDKNRRALIV